MGGRVDSCFLIACRRSGLDISGGPIWPVMPLTPGRHIGPLMSRETNNPRYFRDETTAG